MAQQQPQQQQGGLLQVFLFGSVSIVLVAFILVYGGMVLTAVNSAVYNQTTATAGASCPTCALTTEDIDMLFTKYDYLPIVGILIVFGGLILYPIMYAIKLERDSRGL